LRTVTLSAPKRLGGLFANVPTLLENGVACKVGMWRGIIAAGGIPPAATAFWNRTLAKATTTADWQAELAKKYWANTFVAGAEELAFLDEERDVMTAALGDLGLLPK
jgi:putative tricarboxylic transport membrane protein